MKRRNKAMFLVAKIVVLAYVIVWPAACTIIKENVDAPIDHPKTELLVGEASYSKVLNQLGPPAKVSALGKASRQALLLVFDEQGILQNQRFHEWDENLGGGSSVQFFIAVSSLVDTSQFEDAIGPHQ